MALETPLFAILDDGTGEGVALSKRVKGGAVATASEAPVLGAEDSAGNLYHVPLRDEGETSTAQDAVPGLVSKDPSSNLAYLKVDADGSLIVTEESAGTLLKGTGVATPGALDVSTTVLSVTLAASKNYKVVFGQASSMFPAYFRLALNDNAVDTILARGMAGSGDYNWDLVNSCIEFSSGATGAQLLRVYGFQIQGKLSDMTANLVVLEKD